MKEGRIVMTFHGTHKTRCRTSAYLHVEKLNKLDLANMIMEDYMRNPYYRKKSFKKLDRDFTVNVDAEKFLRFKYLCYEYKTTPKQVIYNYLDNINI